MDRAQLAADRMVLRPPALVRTALRQALQAIGAEVTQYTPGHVIAVIGSRARSALTRSDHRVSVSIRVVGTPTRSRVLTVLRSPGAALGGDSPESMATEVAEMIALQVELDAELGQLGTTAGGLTPPKLLVPAASKSPYRVALTTRWPGRPVLSTLVCPVVTATGAAPTRLIAGQKEVTIPAARLEQLLEQATYIGAHPANAGADHEHLVALVVALWLAQGHPGTRLTVPPEIHAAGQRVEQQLQIRAMVPTRHIQTCLDCRFEKVINPDFNRLSHQNRIARNGLAVGAAAMFPAATPLMVGIRALQLVSLEPRFTCPRCQGLHAEDQLACLCPGCGRLRKEPILTTCASSGCGYDFTILAGPPEAAGSNPQVPGRLAGDT